jgi:beta-glucosidase
MSNNSVVDERTLREIYLTNFEIAVKEGKPKSIMTAYNKVNGIYANENEHLLQDILVKEWGFSGAVISDWGGSNDHVEGVRAGSHLEMPGTGGDSDRQLEQAVKEGLISEEIVDRRVDELLDLILSVQLPENTKNSAIDIEFHHEMAEKAAEQTVVLLKNNSQLLPLEKGTRVAIVGDFAANPRYQGAGSSLVNPTRLESTLDVIDRFELENIGYAPGYKRNGQPGQGNGKSGCGTGKTSGCSTFIHGAA